MCVHWVCVVCGGGGWGVHCVCVCVCVCAGVHAHVYTERERVCVCVCVCVLVCVWIPACVHTYVRACVHACVCVWFQSWNNPALLGFSAAVWAGSCRASSAKWWPSSAAMSQLWGATPWLATRWATAFSSAISTKTRSAELVTNQSSPLPPPPTPPSYKNVVNGPPPPPPISACHPGLSAVLDPLPFSVLVLGSCSWFSSLV